jgi:hypothetical protein
MTICQQPYPLEPTAFLIAALKEMTARKGYGFVEDQAKLALTLTSKELALLSLSLDLGRRIRKARRHCYVLLPALRQEG